jgi:hypothetical protein
MRNTALRQAVAFVGSKLTENGARDWIVLVSGLSDKLRCPEPVALGLGKRKSPKE